MRIDLLERAAVHNPFFVWVLDKQVIDDFLSCFAAFHPRANKDSVIFLDVVIDFVVRDDDPVPKLGFGSYSHELVILHDGTGKVHHVDQAASHTGRPKSGGMKEAGATDYENATIFAFFAPGLGQFDLFEIGGEVKVLHKNLL